MKTLTLFLFASISAFLTSCSTAPPEKPYLNIVGFPVFVADSTGQVTVAGDSAVVVSMNDNSSFRLKPGTSEGYGQLFSWKVDDSTEAVVHRVVFSARPSALGTLERHNIYDAYYYPIVSNSTEFLSTLPFHAILGTK